MSTALVLGSTGKIGRRVVRRLTARNMPVRIGSKDSGLPFDWDDRSTWAPVLQDVTSAYLAYCPDLAVSGAAAKVGDFAAVAASSGVRNLVLLSERGEVQAQAAEQLVRDAGADWTIVRACWFDQNFSEGYLLNPIRSGAVYLPADQIPEPFADADDIAEVVTAALSDPWHAGQVYDITGPRLLTFADAVAIISSAAGRDISFTSVSPADFSAALAAEGVPDDVTYLLNYMFTTVLDGRNANLGDGVQRALGRAPRDFTDYARETAATGVWTGRKAA